MKNVKKNAISLRNFWMDSILNCCVKVTTVDLHKPSLKMRECSSENSAPKIPARVGPCPALHYPPAPRKEHLWWIFFAWTAMNDPLSAELKLRENTGGISLENLYMDIETWPYTNSKMNKSIHIHDKHPFSCNNAT